MFDLVINFTGQITAGTGLKEAPFIQGKLAGGALFTVRNHRHLAAGNRLEAGYGFYFHIRCMDIKITGMDQVDEFLLLIKAEGGLVRKA